MVKFEARIGIFLLFFISGVSSAWADVSVSASVDRNQATLEDEIYLTVSVKGLLAGSSEPVLPPMPAFKAISSSTSSSIQIINGNVETKKEFSYILIPKDEGTHTIGPITVFAGGREYKSQPITIRIGSASPSSPVQNLPQPGGEAGGSAIPVPENEGKEYWITAEVSNADPYVNEQILYTFRFFTRLNTGTAQLTIPEFRDFWSEEVVPEKKYYKTIGTERYVVSEKVIALYPLKSGSLEIPETSLRIEVPDDVRDRFFNDPFFSFPSMKMKQKNLRAKPIPVLVKPLPPEKPDNFTNLVGQFGLSVNLSKSEIKMSDSTTLNIELSGRGNVKDGILKLPAELPAFKIYDDRPAVETVKSETGIQGKKSFKKALVPVQSGEFSIPSFSVSYFDPQKGTYENLESPSLVVRVLPSEAESLNPVTAQSQPKSPSSQLPVIAEDIATIHLHPAALEPEQWGSGSKALILAGLVFPPLLFFGTLIFQWRQTQKRENASVYRSRLARRNFQKRVEKLSHKGGGDGEVLGHLVDYLRDYVGDRCGVYGRGLPVADITRHLEAHAVGRDLTAQLDQLMHQLEYSRYGGETKKKPSTQWIAEAKKLVGAIDRKVGKKV